MHDNKVRLSADILEKAEQIAAEWGLKNARAAVEAVFRTYCDDYLYGRANSGATAPPVATLLTKPAAVPVQRSYAGLTAAGSEMGQCEALDALDQLLAL